MATGRKWRRVDIGVLTVIPVELECVRAALEIDPGNREKASSGRIYYQGELKPRAVVQPHRIAVTCIGEAGPNECAVTTAALIHRYHPGIVILVGIAAGYRGQTKIGSVVLSERVWSYDKEAVLTGKRRRVAHNPRPEAGRLFLTVQQDVTHYMSLEDRAARIERHFRQMRGSYPTPPSDASDAQRRQYQIDVTTRADVLEATIASGSRSRQ